MRVATTGNFSKTAKEAAEEHPTHLRLIDYEELQRQLRALKSTGVRDIAKSALERRKRVVD